MLAGAFTHPGELQQLRVHVPDRPGVLAGITQALGAQRINIEDFELHHVSPERGGTLTLLVDADDTLWENNIYFERAIANFISFLNHHEYTPEQVREIVIHLITYVGTPSSGPATARALRRAFHRRISPGR